MPQARLSPSGAMSSHYSQISPNHPLPPHLIASLVVIPFAMSS